MVRLSKMLNDFFWPRRAQSLPEPPQPLTGILHFLAYRHARDEGFLMASTALSVDTGRFVSRVRLELGQILGVKIASGARTLDLAVRVVRVAQDSRGRYSGEVRFLDLKPQQRMVFAQVLRRLRAPSVSVYE